MKPANEKELWEFVGEVRTDIKAIKATLVDLPCKSQGEEIQKLKEFQDKQRGELKVLGVIWGAIVIGISWFLGKH